MKRLYIGIVIGLILACFAFSAQAQTANLKFAVISDFKDAALDQALEFIVSQKVDFIIVPGDYDSLKKYYPHFLSFGFGVTPGDESETQMVYFALGNHDDPPFGENIFQENIAPGYPQNGPKNAPPGTIYSFDRGDCHFTVTNPYWEYPHGGYTQAQLDWIEQDLAQSEKTYKFVIGHEPAFPQKRHVDNSLNEDPAMRDRFWDILSENGAKAFFCGHTHYLSHLLFQGVYQINTGEIRGDHLCVTIVSVDADKAMVSSYETAGEKPEPGDRVCQTTIDPSEKIESNDIQYLYGAAPVGEKGEGGNNGNGCFISSMMFEER
jgi:predicted phosphodiesterase